MQRQSLRLSPVTAHMAIMVSKLRVQPLHHFGLDFLRTSSVSTCAQEGAWKVKSQSPTVSLFPDTLILALYANMIRLLWKI